MTPQPDRGDRDHDSGDDLTQQAWTWLRRLNSGDVTSWDADAFKRWLNLSAAHKQAFSQVRQEWDALRPAAGSVLQRNPEAARLHAQAVRAVPPSHSRRAFLGVAVGTGLAAAAGAAVLFPPAGLWPSPAEWNADVRTATGEQRTLALANRVNVTLNTQTSIRRSVAGMAGMPGIAGIDLLAGEAAVDLADGGNPFVVIAGEGRSVAQSGQFEVRRIDGKVCVTCIEGSVRIDHPAGVQLLHASQQAVYDKTAISGIARIVTAEVSAWRNGELVFKQASLARVLDEINRYRPGRIVLMNTAVRDKPVSGSFSIALLDAAVAQLQRTFDLRARSLPGRVIVLS